MELWNGCKSRFFYNGLNIATKQMLNTASGGLLYNKQPSATYTLIKEMSNNGYQWSYERSKPGKEARIYKVDVVTTLATLVEAITKRLDLL